MKRHPQAVRANLEAIIAAQRSRYASEPAWEKMRRRWLIQDIVGSAIVVALIAVAVWAGLSAGH